MRRNAIFNAFSRLFSAGSAFLFVPIYIGILGADGFAVIALSLVVLSILTILDLGLSAAIGREMARQDISESERKRAFLVVERVYWALALIVCLLSFLAGPVIAGATLNESTIDKSVIALCLTFVMIEACAQLVFRFHINVLNGLTWQIRASIISIIWTLLRNGAVIGVILLKPDLIWFFAWQMSVTIFFVLIMTIWARQFVNRWPAVATPFFDVETLRRIGHFAGGMLLISVVAVLNTQVDRMLISVKLSAMDLAGYTLAATIGSSMLVAAGPIMTAALPRLTQLFTTGKADQATHLYRQITRAIAVLVFPCAVSFSMHAQALVFAWTGNQALSAKAALVLPLLVSANALVAVATTIYAVAIANGYTRLNNQIGLASLVFSIPGYFIALSFAGATGVAMLYLAVQAASIFVLTLRISSRFLGGGFWKSLLLDQALPFLGALAAALIFSAVIPLASDSRLYSGIYIGVSIMFGIALAALLAFAIMRLGAEPSPARPKAQ